jgi:hypothetical protein
MAIGTAAAIGLGIAGVGSFLGSKSQNKAANKAADTSLQVAAQNNALAKDIYGQNQQALSPYMQRGNAAGDTMNALLGLGGPQQAPQGQPQSFYSGANPAGPPQGMGYQNPMQTRRNALLGAEPVQNYAVPGYAGGTVSMAPNQGGQSQQQAASNAFDIFRNSTGYQFRLGEGMNALNSGYAGAGVLQSGDAMRSAQEYGQNFASGEFGNYLGYLGNQQGVGLSGASALAGVGQNYANSVMTNNNNAGTSVANAALAKGANNPFAGTLGLLGGGLFGMAR